MLGTLAGSVSGCRIRHQPGGKLANSPPPPEVVVGLLKELQALRLWETWALREFYHQQSRKRQQPQDLLLA